jgi:uncharacterized protein (TIGR03790 family)
MPAVRRTIMPVMSIMMAVMANPAYALEPAEVILLVNRNVPESAAVAEHYRVKRKVPKENVITLDLPKTEDINRNDYDAKMVAPIRAALKERKETVKVLLCIYGVPLRVGTRAPDDKDKPELANLQSEIKAIQDRLKANQDRAKSLEPDAKKSKDGDAAKELKTLDEERKRGEKELRIKQDRQKWLSYAESHASVDSELMLLWWDNYELRRFLVNPLHFQYPPEKRKEKPPVLMTARLDGPSADLAKRLVDDAIEVEKTGLKGKVYVDARDSRYDPKSDPGYGYGGYDESMREMAALLKNEAKLEVILDNKSAVFPPGSCPDSALYCGWYSHANFVDSNKFVKGAVAWHLASSEAVSLRRKDLNLWCRNVLEKGACATLGPVAEPYTVGFPKPAEFFGFLVTGEYTLVECYSRSLVLTSWMCTLIGDPLYNPYKNNPRMKSDKVVPSPRGGKFITATE